eukprot:CAMPEP_0114628346 /NCGR_PEP_ID=MMETSP0168-20121206/12774_1 /TAXON_ID=95228 ORGANISM="Vannella sp., Strain DIVA3 517/6/12" /NCGR_SAMPLE_ID=MMETSP0168 /ASSEMBLY_ACC=CAM_ASM_000044 /LENGTH=366 /DNA_ID=CAMNT_0001839727 /DNA_START=21 /DNA_END=1117 /DNA_ORIENTATION=-
MSRAEDADVLLVGTYTEDFPWGAGHAGGVYLFTFSADANGKRRLKYSGVSAEAGKNPSYLSLHPSLPLVFVANELNAFEQRGNGAVTAMRLHRPKSGLSDAPPRLSLAGQFPGGKGVCHIGPLGDLMGTANYVGGDLVAYSVSDDGESVTMEERARVEHSGGGSNAHAFRQDAAHPHCVTELPGAKGIVIACDLGQDIVYSYRLSREQGWTETSRLSLLPASGPRHTIVTADGKFAFIACELDLTVIVCECNSDTGELTVVQRIELFEEGLIDGCTAATIKLTPDERHLYVSTRASDFIVGFHISRLENSVRLERFCQHSTRGSTARDFDIHPSGRFLVASNGDSDTLILFSIDAETGALSEEQIV